MLSHRRDQGGLKSCIHAFPALDFKRDEPPQWQQTHAKGTTELTVFPSLKSWMDGIWQEGQTGKAWIMVAAFWSYGWCLGRFEPVIPLQFQFQDKCWGQSQHPPLPQHWTTKALHLHLQNMLFQGTGYCRCLHFLVCGLGILTSVKVKMK